MIPARSGVAWGAPPRTGSQAMDIGGFLTSSGFLEQFVSALVTVLTAILANLISSLFGVS